MLNSNLLSTMRSLSVNSRKKLIIVNHTEEYRDGLLAQQIVRMFTLSFDAPPRCPGYSQSTSRPSKLYAFNIEIICDTKSLRCSAVAATREKRSEPSFQPPMATMIFTALLRRFRFCRGSTSPVETWFVFFCMFFIHSCSLRYQTSYDLPSKSIKLRVRSLCNWMNE